MGKGPPAGGGSPAPPPPPPQKGGKYWGWPLRSRRGATTGEEGAEEEGAASSSSSTAAGGACCQSHPFSLIMCASSMMYLPSLYFWLDSKACSYFQPRVVLQHSQYMSATAWRPVSR